METALVASSLRARPRRVPYGQFSKVRSGEMGPAPGTFELSKDILKRSE